jgi:hypothetical protein
MGNFSIPETLQVIKDQLGLDLKLCELNKGVQSRCGKKYFNVVIAESTCFSKEYAALERFAKKYNLFSVEPNGANRVAICQVKKT